MACKVVEQSIKLEGAKVYWGKEQCRNITLVADSSSNLSGEYFDLNTLDASGTETKYYVFLKESSDTPVDPAPAGKTKIEVVYTENDTASTIGGLIVAALASVDVNSELDGNNLHLENTNIGMVTEEVYTNAPSFTFSVENGTGGYLGRTAEGITVSIETQSTEINANQSGLLVIDEIFQGQTGSCEAGFIELTKERLEYLIAGAVGDTYTPASGTELIGGGQSRLFQSLKANGGKLILHPQRLPDTDRSEDFVFWKSAPKVNDLNYSGTDVQTLNVTFTAYQDDSVRDEISLYAIGDWSQDVSK